MSMADIIAEKINQALQPEHLEIRNDSDKHKGHLGYDGSGESHFHLVVVSAAFEGKNRIERQRLIYDALQNEMKNQIHALSLSTLSPSEYSQ